MFLELILICVRYMLVKIHIRESYNPKCKFIGIRTAISDIIKRRRLIHKSSVCARVDWDFPGMASDQGNFDINIKSFFFWKVKITNQTFRVDIFGTEQKELILFQHMCHIVVRTITTVTNINVFSSFNDLMAVNHFIKKWLDPLLENLTVLDTQH